MRILSFIPIAAISLAGLATVPAAAQQVTGKPAGNFRLTDADGKSVTLDQFKGRPVVLEWNNPGCPFVQKHYDSGNMQATQAKAKAAGAVWLTINSGAPGKQGYMTGPEAKKFVTAQKAQPKAAPKAPPAKDRPTRPTGRLDGIAEGLSRSQPKSPASKGAPAAATAAEVRRSIDVSIKAKVGPRWNGCRISGVDVDQLKTVVKFKLTQSGALAGFTSVNTTGENDSNKFQVQRHQECAKRAVELAAPFDLPEENYSFWQNYTLDFIKR